MQNVMQTSDELADELRATLRKITIRVQQHPKEINLNLVSTLETAETELDLILVNLWSTVV